jgi:hypothetical protein
MYYQNEDEIDKIDMTSIHYTFETIDLPNDEKIR